MPHGYAVEDAAPPRGFPMILDTDIHNFYEHLVLKEIEKQGLARTLTPYQLADLCPDTQPASFPYIRHDVDMIYFTTDAERSEMEKKVIASLRQAYDKIQAVPTRQA
jgi:hypothetical protein